MNLEVGDKRGPSTKPDTVKKSRAYPKGDVISAQQSRLECPPASKPQPISPITRFTIEPSESRTQSKTELTRKEVMSQECAQRQIERLEELTRERAQDDDNAEVLGIPLPFRSIGERSSMTDLHKLLLQCPEPQPPLLNKQLKTLQLNVDQALIMTEQVTKMKTGMERLQEVIKKFNCTEKFKQDIDFIIANVGPALAKSEEMRRNAGKGSSEQKKRACK